MRVVFEWSRWRRFASALSIAALVGLVVNDLLGLSRAWCLPAGLFVAVQLQKNGFI